MRETTLSNLMLMHYRFRDTFRRDIFWLTARYKNATGALGDAARRLMQAETLEQCTREDLETVIAKVFETPHGFYISSARAQGAALRIQALMTKTGVA